MRQPRTAMEWLQDFLDCLMGEHGDWWRERADESAEEAAQNPITDGTSWKRWREIRMSERAP